MNGYLDKRKDFNEGMRAVYGDEILATFDTFSTEKAVVWIDPLDGTKEYLSGNLSAVTVLIGLAIDGVPKIGVVHHPFKTNENDGTGLTIFGTQEHGAFSLDYNKNMSKEELEKRVPKYLEPFVEEFSDDHTVKVACSLSNMNQ